MKFTVDTLKETIQFQESFTINEFLELYDILPEEWQDFTVENEKVLSPTTVIHVAYPTLIPQPCYPVTVTLVM